MLYAVLFEDAADAPADLRRQYMAAHLDFLTTHSDQILAAGPLSEGEAPAGGLWLVEADKPTAVEALIHADPFWPTGLRASVRVLAWTRVFANGQRLIDPQPLDAQPPTP
ncbi:MAG: YciI family protein [Pseudomonadota bacterium]